MNEHDQHLPVPKGSHTSQALPVPIEGSHTATDANTNDAAPVTADADILSHVKNVWDGIRPNSTIYRLLLSDLEWVSASHGRIIARLRLQPVHLNSKRTLHGSVSATIVDWAGGMAIASTGLNKTGVSTDIHVSYVSAAKDNDLVEIEAWVNRVGRSLAYTTVEIRKVAGEAGGKGLVVCTGSHTKYLAI
ncbi:HotDog domain-containing protein [Coniochaeta sp. 2T2.1]|nr:HotDog domain-containing protein [Coniochaeta sp. 2T2.1]